MVIRKIAQMGHPVLRQRSEEVVASEIGSLRIQTLIDDMIETMQDANGAGIAAPQVHEPLRISVIEVDENPRYPDFPGIPLMVLVNPVLTPLTTESIALYEGCLSVNGIRGRVERPRRVRVQALDRQGKELDFVWEGVPAAVVQHECDHLDGVLFVDRADPRTLAFLSEFGRYVPIAERLVDGVELQD